MRAAENIFKPFSSIRKKEKLNRVAGMKITSAKQILENCKWSNSNTLNFDLYSEMITKFLPVTLFFDPQKKEKEIREKTIKSIIEFQKLPTIELINIHNAMWDFVLKWKSENDRVHMGINNKSDAISKSRISGVGFINEEALDHSYFEIFLNVDWDIEHGITISYFNGKLDDVQ